MAIILQIFRRARSKQRVNLLRELRHCKLLPDVKVGAAASVMSEALDLICQTVSGRITIPSTIPVLARCGSILTSPVLPEKMFQKVAHHMAEQNPSIVSFSWSITNATTASPEFVRPAITMDVILVQKTRWVVLCDERGTFTASIFRESSDAPGSWSRDIYVWTGRAWKFRRKDSKKYTRPPDPPSDANATEIDGVECWMMHRPTDEQVKLLHELISRTPPPGRVLTYVAHSVIR